MASGSTSKPFPGFSLVYALETRDSGHPFFADLEMTDEQCRRITRAEMTLPHPVEARWFMGRKKPSDLIDTTLVIPLLVSERVITLLGDAGFTGWGTYDVDLVGHDDAPIPGYHGLAIHGRCGPIDYSKSKEIPTIMPGGVFPHWFGLYFDPDTWDGSDLFMSADNSGWMFVVDEVKRAFEKAKIKNVEFTNLVEIERIYKE